MCHGNLPAGSSSLPTMAELPEGLHYTKEFIPIEEERALLREIQQLCFAPLRSHGIASRRRVVHYGVVYGYDPWKIAAGPPVPDFLTDLRFRCAEWLGLPAEALVEALVSEYTPGAGIQWHRDDVAFGMVAAISLAGTCQLRLRDVTGLQRRSARLIVEPRSAYALTGTVRRQWQHQIPPVKELRYSVTFRTMLSGSTLEPS